MKRVLPAAFLLLILLTIALLLGKEKIGDIRPAFLPAPALTTETKSGGTQVYQGPLKAPDGFKIEIIAEGLGNPRDLEFSPRGALLVSIPNEGKVIALFRKDPNGPYQKKDVVANLNNPHGIAFYDGRLYVAEETSVSRYMWDEERLLATKEKTLFALPSSEGGHFTRSLAFNKNGVLFVSIGSTCNVCFEKNPLHSSVVVSDSEGSNPRTFATGLRNAVFITVHPETGELWGTEMGRDFLGDELSPDEINIIREGKDYGWPICYGNRVLDTNFDKKIYKRNPCEETEPPIYKIAAHSAPLGLVFISSEQFPKEWQGDLLVAYHGSWNRSTPIGYKVVRLDIEEGRILGEYDFITGFLEKSSALGRPVDLAFDKNGALYVSDDKGGIIYRVSYQR